MRQIKFSGLNNLRSRICHLISKSLCQCGQSSGGCRRTPQNFNCFLCSFILSCSSASFILFLSFCFSGSRFFKMLILSDYYPDCISKDPFFLIWTLVEMESNRDIFKSFSNACGRQAHSLMFTDQILFLPTGILSHTVWVLELSFSYFFSLPCNSFNFFKHLL